MILTNISKGIAYASGGSYPLYIGFHVSKCRHLATVRMLSIPKFRACLADGRLYTLVSGSTIAEQTG